MKSSPELMYDLVELEDSLWRNEGGIIEFSDDGFRAAVKIFTDAMLYKMWALLSDEKIPFDDRLKMAGTCGEEIRKLVKTYANIDTHDMYKNPNP